MLIVNKIWIPPLDYVDYKASTYFSSDDVLYQYLMCFYYMVACIGGNELGPIASVECLFITFAMISAAIINANLFGQMAFLVTVINKKSTEY